MVWELFTLEQIVEMHDMILNPGELTACAGDKSLDAALMRVEHRVHFGLIEDEYHLAATYAMVIATGHCFNDGNKRTALQVMNTCLDLYQLEIVCEHIKLADTVVELAQSKIDEDNLAQYLRRNSH